MHSYLLASSLLLPSAFAAGFYAKGSPVINLDFKTYDSLIAKSNYTSIVEFYAPWCGHCQNLKPAYEKAAKSLTGLAKVAAVNCDDEENKPFCGSMEVKGFPTLKIVRPNSKKPGGRPIVEDYQGQRSAKAIVDAVIDKIPNHVTRLKDKEVDRWVKTDGAKAILFSDKGTVSALLKSLAIDYLGVISFAQIRDKETAAVQKYGIEKFPALILIPEAGEPSTYSADMKKEAMLEFLKTVAQPNPDPPAKKAKSTSTKTNKSKASKDSSTFAKSSASQASSEAAEAQPTQKSESIVDDNPFPSPDPKVSDEKPIKVPDVAPPIPELADGLSLQQKCLNSKAGTCILALLPDPHPENPYPSEAVRSLSEIHAKHSSSGRKIFPFYQLPKGNSQAQALRKLLKLDEGTEIIAINGKKSWWRRFEGYEYLQPKVETWIDEIRMGDGAKQKIPKTVIIDAADLPAEPVKVELGEGERDMYEKIKAQLPEGVDLAMEEIDDAEYERMMKASENAEQEPAKELHDEL